MNNENLEIERQELKVGFWNNKFVKSRIQFETEFERDSSSKLTMKGNKLENSELTLNFEVEPVLGTYLIFEDSKDGKSPKFTGIAGNNQLTFSMLTKKNLPQSYYKHRLIKKAKANEFPHFNSEISQWIKKKKNKNRRKPFLSNSLLKKL